MEVELFPSNDVKPFEMATLTRLEHSCGGTLESELVRLKATSNSLLRITSYVTTASYAAAEILDAGVPLSA